MEMKLFPKQISVPLTAEMAKRYALAHAEDFLDYLLLNEAYAVYRYLEAAEADVVAYLMEGELRQ